MYKQAAKLKLRFLTNKGFVSVEQLFELSMTDIANAIKAVKKILKTTDDDELAFLESTRTVDVENQLRFNILKDVYLTKKEENEAARTAFENKEFNQKILAIIADKEEDSLKGKSINELKAMIR